MTTWVKQHYWLGGFVMLAMVIATIVFLAMPLAAAPIAKEPEVFVCDLVAKAKAIDVYRCEDEELGVIFYVNQLGFMFPEPY